MIIRTLQIILFGIFLGVGLVSAQLVTDPLTYAPIANPLPDTMNQLYRDSLNIVFSPIRLNQAGYRPQDTKYFYYVGTGASTFKVIDEAGTTVGTGSLTATGQTSSGQMRIRASNNATLVSGGDTRYIMESPEFSGPLSEGLIPDLPPGVYRIVVGNTTSHRFVIDERVYSWVRDALLKFYGVNRCGDSKSWFHPACHTKDAVTGGWHDCGDHLKEGATMSYAAAVLGLAAAAFFDRDADMYSADQGVTAITDGIPDILYEAKHGADFILQSYDKAGGQVGEMITSIGGFGGEGETAEDHSWWGRPEYQDLMPMARGGPPRPARNEPTSDYLGKYAANLAFVSKRFRPYNEAYADRCLKAAKDIYEFTKTRLDLTNTPAYNGATIVTDDVAFGCLALLWATGERAYLDELCFDKTIGVKASATFAKLFQGGWFTNNDPLFNHGSANTDWASSQAHVLWGFFRLVLSDEKFCIELGLTESERLGLIEKTIYNLIANLSSVGLGTQSIDLPSSDVWVPPIIKYDLPWFTMHTQMEWVWNRYQAGNITEMFYYYDIASKIQGMELPNTPASTDWKAEEVKTVLVRMLDYMIGVNPWDISMIYGVGEKNFNHPHHRAANPEGKNVPGAFYDYCPPVGALQGGYKPTTSLYAEHYDDWMHSETGIDGTTNILMPVLGLAKEDTLGPPSGTVRVIYVGCDNAIIEIRQTRFGNALVRYGAGLVHEKTKSSDTDSNFHTIELTGLTNGTTYNFDVVVADVFGRDSTLKYLNEEKQLVDFSFTTLQNCPTNAEIANVKVCQVTHDSAEIFWYTPNGAFDSKVVYGEQLPPTMIQNGDVAEHPVKFHFVQIGGLKEKTKYYFYVESGTSRDDNNGQLYTFTTPVEHVNFDVRAVRYEWEGLPTIGLNIMNQDSKRYDSLELRLYVRGPETYTLTKEQFGIFNDTVVRFEDHVMFRVDIGIKYRSDGFQDLHFKTELDKYVQSARPVRMEDTYDAATNTWGYYIPVPMGDAVMESGARFRIDISMQARSPWPPNLDAWNTPSLKEITDADWSFGPHHKPQDPIDYAGVPIMTKEDVDASNFNTPVNNYITVYRKGEYVWGYSPSPAEMKTKKTHYEVKSQITSPLNNPSDDYVFYERSVGQVDVSGWAKVKPVDGTINEVWIDGIPQPDLLSHVIWSEAEQQYNFTIPVKVKNGPNEVDVTLFAGPDMVCEECYGCGASNHHFFIEFQGAKQYASTLVLRDPSDQPLGDTVHLDTTQFRVIVTDRNGNVNGGAKDKVTATLINPDNGDTTILSLVETGDSTGIFISTSLVSVVDRTPEQSDGTEIAMNGGDRVRIFYVDPTDETDISEAYIFSKASFPVARRGYLKDVNGDGSVDFIAIEYSIALKQNPDSVTINFPTSGSPTIIRTSGGEMTISDNSLSIFPAQPFENGVTGFTAALSGNGVSYLTSTGMVKTSNFPLYDSAGPVLNGQAVVREREAAAGYDTVEVTFSEGYRIDAFEGDVFLLRKGDTDHPVAVIALLSSDPALNSVLFLLDSKGQSFVAGDSLFLNSASTFVDFSGNHPYIDNRRVPVMIKAGSPSIRNAYYQDTDANGQIDKITLSFSKALSFDNMSIGLRWNEQPLIIVDKEVIQYLSATEVAIQIGPAFTQNEINTSGLLEALLLFPTDTISGYVADSAAPVIRSAFFSLSSELEIDAHYYDTLDIVFSEMVDNFDGILGFNLISSVTQLPYTFTVTEKRTRSQDTIRFIGIVNDIEFPNSGDLIWLQKNAMVTDLRGNSQNAENNRRAPVIVKDPYLSLKNTKIEKGPNPFHPLHSERFKVTIEPVSRFPMQLDSSATTIVYDKVGNIVAKLRPEKTVKGIEFTWNGRNKKGRVVGTGTYLMMLYFKNERQNIPVGVDHR